jgi:hypothetical protein
MQTLIHHDLYNIITKKKKESTSPFLGLVRVFENGVLNTDQSTDGWLENMTIAKGREFAAQSIFRKIGTNSTIGDTSNFKVDSFGIGLGGSTIGSDTSVTLKGPNVCDLDLYAPIKINTFALPNSQGIESIVKKIEMPGPGGLAGSITSEISSSSEYSSCATYYTVMKCVCIVDTKEPTYLNPGEVVKIDEAMLYATSENNQVVPFAHICFAPKFIEKESVFTIEWYVIF